MPQMAPISWLTLFLIFSTTLMLFCIMNYFIITPNVPTSSKKSILSTPINWKW